MPPSWESALSHNVSQSALLERIFLSVVVQCVLQLRCDTDFTSLWLRRTRAEVLVEFSLVQATRVFQALAAGRLNVFGFPFALVSMKNLSQ